MKAKAVLLIGSLILFIYLSGCAPRTDAAGQVDYEETKKMVVDIFKTDDGKKALKEVLKDEEIKQSLVMDQAVVQDTIEKTLTSDKGKEFWQKTFEDPKFSEKFAQSLQDEHKKVLKDLMKDPDYEKMFLEILKDPQMEEQYTKVLKSQEYRKHVQEVITETMASPLFKSEIEKTLLKAAQEMGGQQGGAQGGGGGQQSDQGGGGGGGGG